eukprot:SAG22_NODE_2267_length_2763_cov_3.832584_2_plen_65_part_00
MSAVRTADETVLADPPAPMSCASQPGVHRPARGAHSSAGRIRAAPGAPCTIALAALVLPGRCCG